MEPSLTILKTNHRHIEGVVISNKMQKTIVVQVVRLAKHPKYKKYFRKYKKYKVHDEKQECQIGDRIEMIEGRPLSREKRFRLVRVIEKGQSLPDIEVSEV